MSLSIFVDKRTLLQAYQEVQAEMNGEPQLVQNIAKDQGIDISPIDSPSSTFGFLMYYGDKSYCDISYSDHKTDCSEDGILWSTDDGALMCTTHLLKIKDYECEFVEVPIKGAALQRPHASHHGWQGKLPGPSGKCCKNN